MLHPDTPLVFADGNNFFDKLSKTYKVHNQGFFVLAPSGSGKTHYINAQSSKDWIDGDELWTQANAHPDSPWWTAGDTAASLREIDLRSDIITMQAKKKGFWIMGASNLILPPDAIVMPDWETHKGYIDNRQNTNYDGGATNDKLQQVLDHRKRIMGHAKGPVPSYLSLMPEKNDPPPVFSSVSEAADYLASVE